MYYISLFTTRVDYYVSCSVCNYGYKINKKKIPELVETGKKLPSNLISIIIWNLLTDFISDHIMTVGEKVFYSPDHFTNNIEILKKEAYFFLRKKGHNSGDIKYVLGIRIKEFLRELGLLNKEQNQASHKQ